MHNFIKASLQVKLKESTRELHSQIESVPLLNKIIKRNITLHEFKLLIKKFYAYIKPCENAINTLQSRHLLSNREKTNLLKNDLVALGLEEFTINERNFSPILPPLNTHAQVLGYMYVIEGSTLGGQIIAKILFETLNLTPETGASFFFGYGKNTRQMWNSFCQILDTGNESEYENETILAAKQAYTTLYDWMLTDQ